MTVENHERADYKVTFTTTIRTDSEGDICVDELGQEDIYDYVKPSRLAELSGWTVEYLPPPVPVGSFRKFSSSGNIVVKVSDSVWVYAFVKRGGYAVGETAHDTSHSNESLLLGTTEELKFA